MDHAGDEQIEIFEAVPADEDDGNFRSTVLPALCNPGVYDELNSKSSRYA